MPNRLDIELTSHRDDGTWTWRVAGARQPKGTAPGPLIPEGARVGDILTVDAEIDLDGITLLSILPQRSARDAKGRASDGQRRIEILGSRRSHEAGVTTVLAGPRRERGTANGGPIPSRRPGRRKAEGNEDGQDRHRAGNRRPQRSGDRPAQESRAGRPRREGAQPRHRRDAGAQSRPEPPGVHRQAFLDSLSAEQRAIADRLVSGGLPAVRRAIDEQNRTAQQVGHPEVPQEPIVAMAENLLPRLKAAAWCDRAEAALGGAEATTLPALRTLASTADEAGRDEPGRSLLERLRTEIHRRVVAARTAWDEQISGLVDSGDILRALSRASSAPDPGARLGAELASRLATEAGAHLNQSLEPAKWLDLVRVAAASPVRIQVRPAAMPAGAPPEVLEEARKLAGRIPALAKLLGIALPPPPTMPPTRTRQTTPSHTRRRP